VVRYWARWKWTTSACLFVVALSVFSFFVLGMPWYRAMVPVVIVLVVIGDGLWERWRR
jgi:hypothetical protein